MADHVKTITIHVDKKEYKVEGASLTGAALRALPASAIGAEYDLLLEVPSGEDRTIADDESVELKNGMHFFSAPRNITPGR